MHLNSLLAQAATVPTTSTAATGAPPSQLQTMLFGNPIFLYVLVFVAFYFVLIRPQQKRAKALAKLVGSMKTGDKVETASGIRGVVIAVKDSTVTLKSFDSKIEVTKSSVTAILESSTALEV